MDTNETAGQEAATETEATEPENAETGETGEQAEQADEQESPPARPGSDVLGTLLDDPQFGEIPTAAARTPVAPLPVYTKGVEAYENCHPCITEAEIHQLTDAWDDDAWDQVEAAAAQVRAATWQARVEAHRAQVAA